MDLGRLWLWEKNPKFVRIAENLGKNMIKRETTRINHPKYLKKNLYKSGGDSGLLAKKGDIVDTFRSGAGDLWIRVGETEMIVWEWEIDELFKDET